MTRRVPSDEWAASLPPNGESDDCLVVLVSVPDVAIRHLALASGPDRRLDGAIRVRDASVEKRRYHGGLIRTRWIRDSVVTRTTILSDVPNGYGYKGSGHEGARIEARRIDVASQFSIESTHENEYGLHIASRILTRCVSVPKGGQSGPS